MRVGLTGCLVAVGLGFGACNSSQPTGSSSVQSAPQSATTGPAPVGVIAIGHSGLTGEGTGLQYEPRWENSWATGTAPEVDSVYLRLSAAQPENLGHVANKAKGGASSDSLASQAEAALQAVPHPSLVIISTIDNDIRCDGTDEEHIPEFGIAVADALEVITSTSPESEILIVGQLGRPSIGYVEELVAHDPSVMGSLSGSGPCAFFDVAGDLVTGNFATLAGLIESYEAEQARVCEAVPHCHTDAGVRAAYVDVLENFSSDWAHLNVKGQAAEAELIWPLVASILNL